MYVRPIFASLLGGRSTPATRAIYFFLPEPKSAINDQQLTAYSFLSLLMLWVDTDNTHHALAVNYFALITNLFDGRTYLHCTLSFLFIPVSYTTAIQIVGRQLDQHPITRKTSDEMLTHLACYV